MAHAIPDPHIERWLLVDSAAFKAVLGVGCEAPDPKCQRDRYKRLLREAIQKAGINPSLGGIEYAADIVAEMDFTHVPHPDESLAKFIAAATQQFRLVAAPPRCTAAWLRSHTAAIQRHSCFLRDPTWRWAGSRNGWA